MQMNEKKNKRILNKLVKEKKFQNSKDYVIKNTSIFQERETEEMNLL